MGLSDSGSSVGSWKSAASRDCMSVPSPALRHHVEVLTKVKQLRVFVWLRDGPLPRIGCKKDPNNGDLLVVLVNASSGSFEFVRVPLHKDISVDPASAQLSTEDGIASCIFKIGFAEDNSSYMWRLSSPEGGPLPLSALKQVACRACAQPLLRNPATLESIVLLPSEHWTDMRDIWTCACTSEMFSEKVPRSKVVRASPRRAQLAAGYIQLHSTDIDHSALTIDHAEPHTVSLHRNWKNLWCVRCGSNIGQAEMPNADTINEDVNKAYASIEDSTGSAQEIDSFPEGSSSAQTQERETPELQEDSAINGILFRNVRLHKHAMKTPSDVSSFEEHSLETKLSAEILAAVSVTGVFKLVFRDYRTRNPTLAITVLGWDSLIFSSSAPLLPGAFRIDVASPAIRLTYSKISGTSPIDPLTPTEIIESDCFSIEALWTLLETRHSSLPPSVSRLGSSPVSFLHYTPPEA